MERILNRSLRVKKLRDLFDLGIFAVPEIQREFVWDARKTRELADSIFRNYPIGTIMIWETGRDNQDLLRRKLHILPQFDDKANKSIYFIIDGQQRLSVLYQLFKGEKITNSSRKEVDFSNIHFCLFEEDGHRRFESTKRPDPDRHVRLHDILDAYWHNKLSALPKHKLKKVRECRERILNYKFNMIFFRTNNLEEVRETFIRINAQGTPVSTADRAFARATHLKLRHLVNELRDSLSHGFSRIPMETLLMTIALANGARGVDERAISAVLRDIEKSEEARTHFQRSWRNLKKAIGQAVDYMVNEYGVGNFGFLPSQNMVTTLSLFFMHNDNRQPNNSQRKQLRRWFWTTALGQRYAGGGYRRNILKDVDFFKRLGRNRKGRFDIEEKLPLYLIKQTDYAKRSGIADAYFCMLRLQKPRYMREGGIIPPDHYSTRANRNDKHHIFPRKLLRKSGFSRKEYDTICNICILDAEENQSIGDQPPARYLEEIKNRKHFAQVMKSHLIPHSQSSGLWKENIRKGFRDLVDERARIIAKSFEDAAGGKIFRRD